MKTLLNSEKTKRNVVKFGYGFLIFGILFFVLYIMAFGQYPGSDHYFMYKHAEVLIKKGFITTDVLRMHPNMHFMIPQWLFALVFYELCQLLGNFTLGYKALMILVFGIFIGTMAWIAYKESQKNKMVLFYALFLALCCIHSFAVARPFYITDVILLFEAYILKKLIESEHKHTKSIEYGYYGILFLLSVLQINIHNSLWIGMVLVWLCFFASALWDVFIKKELLGKEKLKKTCLSLAVIVIGAFVNPYGIEYITYIFKSYSGIKPLSSTIHEILPFFQVSNTLNYIILGIDVGFVLANIKKLKVYDILLYFGFLIMFMMNFRNLVLFYTIGHFGIFHLWNDILYLQWYRDSKSVSYILILVAFIIGMNFITMNVEVYAPYANYKLVDIIDSYTKGKNKDKITIYSNQMDMGSYAIYKGYKPYIDGCAEIYAKSNNQSYDYATEYMNALYSQKTFQKFINKYKFDYLILGEIQYKNNIENQSDYQLIYKEKMGGYNFYIYQIKKERKVK